MFEGRGPLLGILVEVPMGAALEVFPNFWWSCLWG